MAGKRPEIYLTQTNDIGRLSNTISTKLPIHGFIDLVRSIKIAQLSLKHRQNKNQKQRLVVFVGSPLENLDDREMVKLGKQLRKNDVAIDVVNFGHSENIPLLTKLVENCNKGGNSHMIDVGYGGNIADTLITSPVVAYDAGFEGVPADGAEGVAQPGATGGQFAEYGGYDPNLDPEMAMAIRISLEEAKYQGNKPEDAKEGETAGKPDQPSAAGADAEMKDDQPTAKEANEEQDMEEDEEDYDEALKQALLLSMQGAEPEKEETKDQKQEQKQTDEGNEVFDEEFIGEIMNDLGVDMTEDAVKNLLGDEKKDEEKKDNKDKKERKE